MSPELKLCRQCWEVKKESQFRYIKYFGKWRTICKSCESRERQKKSNLWRRMFESMALLLESCLV